MIFFRFRNNSFYRIPHLITLQMHALLSSIHRIVYNFLLFCHLFIRPLIFFFPCLFSPLYRRIYMALGFYKYTRYANLSPTSTHSTSLIFKTPLSLAHANIEF